MHRRMLAWRIQYVVDAVCKKKLVLLRYYSRGADGREMQATGKKQKNILRQKDSAHRAEMATGL